MKSQTVQFETPIDTLGGVIAALTKFTADHPNPSDDPRLVTFRVTPRGKFKGFTVKEQS